ncbi:MAG: ribbon-helix-helix protein, CopG family [Clostridiales bacterium]|nr:ribbon-helix-helix protein, CopG family [Clostridiales bacterium]
MAQLGIRLSDQEKKKLSESAQAQDLTISQIVRKLIYNYLGGNNNGD